MPEDQTQREKFEQAAREMDCDESEERWDARLKKIAGKRPAPDEPASG